MYKNNNFVFMFVVPPRPPWKPKALREKEKFLMLAPSFIHCSKEMRKVTKNDGNYFFYIWRNDITCFLFFFLFVKTFMLKFLLNIYITILLHSLENIPWRPTRHALRRCACLFSLKWRLLSDRLEWPHIIAKKGYMCQWKTVIEYINIIQGFLPSFLLVPEFKNTGWSIRPDIIKIT